RSACADRGRARLESRRRGARGHRSHPGEGDHGPGRPGVHGPAGPRGVLMLGWLFQTDGSLVPLVLRLTLAVVMFPHGAQKTLGWFGGHGFKGAMSFLTKSGIPGPLAFLAIMAEFLGPLGLAVGLLTRVAALGIGIVMLVAIGPVHGQQRLFLHRLRIH